MPRLPTHHAERAIIGINTFVLLCGIKTFQLLNMQPASEPEAPKKPHTHWSVKETHLMLDLLIAQSSRMGQLASFPQPVYTKVARSLPSANKTSAMIFSKFQMVWFFLLLRFVLLTHDIDSSNKLSER